MKKFYLVKLSDDIGTELEGHLGNGEYLVECVAFEEANGEHR